MQWYIKVLKNYAKFEGRARRTEFWMFSLINFGISTISSFIWYMSQNGSGTANFLGLIFTLYGLAVIIPGIAVTVRRLHDIGKSGWWFFIVLVPFIGWVWMLWLLFTDSQPGNNQYGPNPKGVSAHSKVSSSPTKKTDRISKKKTPSTNEDQQKYPKKTAQEHFQNGWAFDEKGKFDEAAEEYRKALHINPDYSLARSNLGMIYKKQGKQDDAIREWEEAINRGIREVVVRMNTEDWLNEAKALRDERLKPIDDVDGAVKSYLEELGKASDKWFVAYDALARIGVPAVDPLIDGLKSENDLLRNRSIDLLAKIGDKRAIAPLEKAAKINEKDFRSITKITGKSRITNIEGMQIKIAFSKVLEEYQRLAQEAINKIKKQ